MENLQKLASAPTKERLEKLINEFFYSTLYKIDGENITGKKGILKDYAVKFEKNKYVFYEVTK